MQLSIALPCYNEEKNIEHTVRDVLAWFQQDAVDGEVILVDDGSTDGSAAICDQLASEHEHVRVIHLGKNEGYGTAVCTGLDACEKEYIAFMDSDGQFSPSDFSKLLPHLEPFDCVVGRRRKRADPFLRKVNAKLFGFLVFAILGVWIRDVNCAMKIFKRDIWKTIRPRVATGALVNAEVFYRMRKNGIQWKQVDVQHFPRTAGAQTGANLRVILRMFRELLTLRIKA